MEENKVEKKHLVKQGRERRFNLQQKPEDAVTGTGRLKGTRTPVGPEKGFSNMEPQGSFLPWGLRNQHKTNRF